MVWLLPSPAQPASTLISPADLDRSIDALPNRVEVDSLEALRARLAELPSGEDALEGSEASGLRTALDIVAACRAIRLEAAQALPAPPARASASPALVAGL